MEEKRRRSDRQKELVAKLYTVHENLRIQHGLVSQEDWSRAWNDHKENVAELQEYAKAMHELATQVWSPRNTSSINCRIEWIYVKCTEFFSSQIKEQKLLKLLDVGSCYNPLAKYEDIFDITAIDLCPAPAFENSVYQCDFLQVPVLEEERTPVIVQSKLVSLPRDYFDIVVFSLFLEYLPDQEQRLECCLKAANILRPGSGVLFIIRPDSNSMTVANVKLTKQWKVGLSLLGLKRIFYEKLTHMWCTGYVKLDNSERESFVASKRFQYDLDKMKFSQLYKLFAIPQDFKSTPHDETHVVDNSVYEKDVGLFDELPFAE